MEKSLHVGVILGQNIPSYWAHSFNVMKMAQGFENIGCKVHVVTAENCNTLKYKKEITDVSAHYGLNRKIKIKYLSPSKAAFNNGNTRHDLTFCKKALKYAKEKGFDFLYCRNHVVSHMAVKEGIPTFFESILQAINQIYEKESLTLPI